MGAVARLRERGSLLIGSVLFFLAAAAVGVTLIWDIGGQASKTRTRLERNPVYGGLYRRLPSWTYRAFGVWWIIVGAGVPADERRRHRLISVRDFYAG